MARGLDKEIKTGQPPRRNPFKTPITGSEELRARQEAAEKARIQAELEAKEHRELLAIDEEARGRFAAVDERVRQDLEEIDRWAAEDGGSRYSASEIGQVVKERKEEVYEWEKAAKAHINRERREALEAARKEAERQAQIDQNELKIKRVRSGTRALLKKAGITDFSLESPGGQALREAGFHREEYESAVRYTDPVLEAEGKSYIAVINLRKTAEEEEMVFEKFFQSKEAAQKATDKFIDKAIEEKIKTVKKKEYSARAKKARRDFAAAQTGSKENKERAKHEELEAFAKEKEAAYRETLKGLNLENSTYSGHPEEDNFLTDPSQVMNVRRETIGDWDIVTWNMVPYGQPGVVIFKDGEVYARTSFYGADSYRRHDGSGAPAIYIPKQEGDKTVWISKKDRHDGTLPALFPGVSRRRLLADARAHISEKTQERIRQELSGQ